MAKSPERHAYEIELQRQADLRRLDRKCNIERGTLTIVKYPKKIGLGMISTSREATGAYRAQIPALAGLKGKRSRAKHKRAPENTAFALPAPTLEQVRRAEGEKLMAHLKELHMRNLKGWNERRHIHVGVLELQLKQDHPERVEEWNRVKKAHRHTLGLAS